MCNDPFSFVNIKMSFWQVLSTFALPLRDIHLTSTRRTRISRSLAQRRMRAAVPFSHCLFDVYASTSLRS